jgi:hypothetical protein
MKTEIVEKAREMSNAEPGTSEFLGKYPAAWTDVVENLDAEQTEEMEKVVEAWNRSGLPEDLKRR